MYRTILILLAIPLVLTAQTAGVEMAWVQQYGSGLIPSQDVASAIAVDEVGNIYVTGTSEYLREMMSGGSGNFTTVKYNPDGSEAWVSHYDGTGNCLDGASALVLDATGNIYVTGTSYQSDNYDGADYATIKYNPDGTEAWVARYNGPGNGTDNANALAVDDSGNIYVTGESDGDYATIKYNPDGTQVWVTRYDGPGNSWDGASALAVDDSGNIYVTGGSWGSESRDYATIKYNPDGTEAWVARNNGPGNDRDNANALAVDDSGNVYVTGTSEGSESRDYATIKYNPDGTEVWAARYNGPENDRDEANALAVDIQGNVYIAGVSFYPDSIGHAIIKYNPDGTEAWVAHYSEPREYTYDNRANPLAVDESGNVYVSGVSEDDYATIKYNPDGTEAWVISYDGPGNGYDRAFALVLDDSGNIYVTGSSEGSESRDYATIKYNPDGLEAWVTSYDGPRGSLDKVSDMAVNGSGNVYVTGKSSPSEDYYDYYFSGDYATIKYYPDGTEAWVSRYDGPGNDYDAASAMAVDAEDNVYVTGTSEGSESRDYATIKYNPDGTEAWVTRYNGPGNSGDGANAIAVDAEDNVYVTGSSRSTESDQSDDYATIKYNPDGTEAWVARYNGLGNNRDRANSIAVDMSQNVYVTGSSARDNPWSGDYTTIKYNADGTEAWVARYSGTGDGDNAANDLVVDMSGNVYVTGGDDGDYATIKYNPDGTEAWVSRYDGPGNGFDEADALAVDANGNVYVAGRSRGLDSYEYATIKYNPDGTEVWVTRYARNDASQDYSYWHETIALALDDSGNVYVSGPTMEAYIWWDCDYTILKYNPDGTEAWLINYDGPENGNGQASALAVDDAGNVYVAGTSVYQTGTRDIDRAPVRAQYTTIKYSQPGYVVSTEPYMRSSEYRLQQNYPNPFNPITTIQYSLPEAGVVNLTIFDIRGHEIMTLLNAQKPPGNYEVQWNGLDQSGNQVSTGVYFARLQTGDYSKTIKMVYLR